MTIHRQPHNHPGATPEVSVPPDGSPQAPSVEIDRAIERFRVRYVAEVQALHEELGRRRPEPERHEAAWAGPDGAEQGPAVRWVRQGKPDARPDERTVPHAPLLPDRPRRRGRRARLAAPTLIVAGVTLVLLAGLIAALLQWPRRAAGTSAATDLPSPTVAVGVAGADTDPAVVPTATIHLTAPTAPPTPSPGNSAGGPTPPAVSVAPPPAQDTATTPVPHGTEAAPLTSVRLPAEMRRHVAVAEAGLRAGQFEATIDDGGTHSAVQVRFARADDQHPARLHITTTATDGRGAPVELVVIGGQSWQRQPDGWWIPVAAQAGMWEQVDALLPQLGPAPDPATEDRGAMTILSWYDAGRNADVTLEVETASGTPRQLQLVTRGDGPTIHVSYTRWNEPVDVAPPPVLPAPPTPTSR